MTLAIAALTPGVAPAAASPARIAPAATAAVPEEFSTMLARMAEGAAETVRTGEATALAGIAGQASPQEVVGAVMAAERALQTTLAIRDKAVAAYLELSRMPI